jgi:hypothetical protein
MKERQELLDTLARSNTPEASLMVIGIILLDIRDLLQLLQPKNIIINGGDAHGRDKGLRSEDDRHS